MSHRRAGGLGTWRCLWDAPLWVAACGAMVLAALALAAVGGALQRAESVRRDTVPELARLAAETGLAATLAASPDAADATVAVGGVRVAVRRAPGGSFEVTSVVAGEGEFRFRCEELPGAAAPVFARASSAVDPGAARLVGRTRLVAREDLPQLDPVQLAGAPRGDRLAAFRADPGVALLSWQAGTDKPDFVFEPARSAELDAAGGLIVLPGHLWIPPGDQPIRLWLERDLTLVVQGNIYFARSLVVDGPGRLVCVARRANGEASFADRDANGSWSPGDGLRGVGAFVGPAEGAGSVYLGLPGSAGGSIGCDAGLVVDGELHVGRPAQVAGPLVLAHGATVTNPLGARLEPRFEWGFDVERERVRGFVTHGAPRPGILRRVASPGTDGQQALYLAGPAR
ncbi:MAG: hypothetical protein JNL08_05095 [Planctomycetes bacterium]|nr:hypothetical protein [Planctomycetota bacterium]